MADGNSTNTDLAYADTLWKSADALRGQVDAAEYKHVVLGLLFLKYISGAFDARREELKVEMEAEGITGLQMEALLENRDEYTAERVFWVLPEARWANLQNQATRPDIATLIDDAILAVERDNPNLKGKLPRDYARRGIEPVKLKGLIDLIADVGFKGGRAKARDTLGRVYDPCCGSGGMFVQSERFGTPPVGNANYAWIQHFIHHLAPPNSHGGGVAGFVMANGSLSSNTGGEGEIRQCIVEADLVDAIVALPAQLFYTTGIPVCLWFLTRSRGGSRTAPTNGRPALRERRDETLFIDARKFGTMQTEAVIVPPRPIREKFAKIVDPLFAHVAAIQAESIKLAEMRDFLLPKLLSGDIRVRDVKQVAEAECAV